MRQEPRREERIRVKQRGEKSRRLKERGVNVREILLKKKVKR